MSFTQKENGAKDFVIECIACQDSNEREVMEKLLFLDKQLKAEDGNSRKLMAPLLF